MAKDTPRPDGDTRDAAIAAYMAAVDAGKTPDREAFLAQHPESADALRAFFDALDSVEAAASPIRPLFETEDVPAAGAVLEPGERVGPYEIDGEIARGGMGVVFRARHVELRRAAAIKMVRIDHPHRAELLRRFRREAKAAAGLEHPAIVKVLEFGEHRGWPWYAMPLLEGGTLQARGRMAPREAAAVMARLADAVQHGHAAGVLHRDLKPANVLLDAEGRAHVADFGLAKAVGAEASMHTATGTVLGTPAYLAPEAIAGASGHTAASDVWSLGAMLYELLTGRAPFAADTAFETIRRIREEDPAPPRALGAHVPKDLETIALHCLEKDPALRYSSAGDLAADIRRFLASEPIYARPAGPLRRLARRLRRRGTAILVFVALASLGLAAWILLGQQADDETRRRRTQLADRLRDARAAALDMDESYAAQNYAVAHRMRPSAETAMGLRGHDVEPPVARHQLDAGSIRRLLPLGDGRVAAACETGALVILDWQTGMRERYAAGTTTMHALAQVPGRGELVSCDDGGGVTFWTPSPWTHERIETGIAQLVGVAVTADARHVVTAGKSSEVVVLDVDRRRVAWRVPYVFADGRPETEHPKGRVHLSVLAAHASEPLVLVAARAGARPEARVLDLASRTFRPGHHTGRGDFWRGQFLADGRVVLSDNDGTRVYPEGDRLMVQGGPASALAVATDERTLIAGTNGGSVVRWDLASAQPIGRPLPHPCAVHAVAVGDAGKHVLTGCVMGVVRVWRTPVGEPTYRILHDVSPTSTVAFDESGEWLLVVGRDATVARVVDARTGHAIDRLDLGARIGAVGRFRGGWRAVVGEPRARVRSLEVIDGRLVAGPERVLAADVSTSRLAGEHAVLEARGALALWHVPENGLPERVMPVPRPGPSTIDPLGAHLAVLRPGGLVTLIDIGARTSRDVRLDQGVPPRSIQLGPGAGWLSTVDPTGRDTRWWDLEGRPRSVPMDAGAPASAIQPVAGRPAFGLARHVTGGSATVRRLPDGLPVGGALGVFARDADQPPRLLDLIGDPQGHWVLMRYLEAAAPAVLWNLERCGFETAGRDPLDPEREVLRAALLTGSHMSDDGEPDDIDDLEWRRLRDRYDRAAGR